MISAPVVSEVALVTLFGLFGWKVAELYMLSGVIIAIVAGVIIGRLKSERFVEDFVWQIKVCRGGLLPGKPTWAQRYEVAWASTQEIVGKVWLYVVVGIAIGAGIHGYAPESAQEGIMGKEAWRSVPAAVLLGVPLYSNAAGIIPVVHGLMEKSASLGTVLAFMMSVIGLSFPETIILRKVLRPQLIAAFVGVVTVGILIVGYLFNVLM